MSKKTRFSVKWLEPKSYPQFANWLYEVKDDKHKAYCQVCKKTFELSNMGIRAVNSHAKSVTHVRNYSAKTSTPSVANILASKSASSVKPANPTTSSEGVADVLPVQPVKNSIQNFVLKDEVTKAECLWALQVVAKKMSFNSCRDVGGVFKAMFEDSAIANHFQLGSSKLSYIVSYGLAPYFHRNLLATLKSCDQYVVCFDEALNKVVQRGQMDLIIRFWDRDNRTVSTRYLSSVFMGKATADDILLKFYEGMVDLPKSKLLQVSMDGPNVNHSFLEKLKNDMKADDSLNKELLDIGTCGLHVVHGSLKTGLNGTGWDIFTILRHMYFLFKDSPARRASFTSLTGSTTFPLKFCSTRWVENVNCLERALFILDNLKVFVNASKVTGSKPFATVKEATRDPLLKCKMAFSKAIASECEPFLKRFQSPKPLVPYLYQELLELMLSLMGRCVKPGKLEEAKSSQKLMQLSLTSLENLLPASQVNIGFASSKFLKEAKVQEGAKDTFKLQCRNMLTSMISKLRERSPLKCRLVRALSCLNPYNIVHTPSLCLRRMEIVLEVLHHSNHISDQEAENAKKQFDAMIAAAKVELKNAFQEYIQLAEEDKSLDTLYSAILDGEDKAKYKNLFHVVKICLILSHGNASVESGFSINKDLLIENLHEETIVNQRRVYDAILYAGGVLSVGITSNLLQSLRCAHRLYHIQLEEKRKFKSAELKRVQEKKAIERELKQLEEKKKRIRAQAQDEEEEISKEIVTLHSKKRKL